MSVFDRAKLLQAVKLAASITPRNSPKVCLQGVKIVTGKDGLMVAATDLETMRLTSSVPGDTDHNFEALPNANRLVSVLNECTDEEVKLSKEDDNLFITGQFAETVLKDCDDPNHYPSPTSAEPEHLMLVPAGKLAEVLKRVVCCAAKESARYALQGVRFELMDGKIILVATDGKSLATEEIECPTAQKQDGNFIVPEKAIRAIMSSCNAHDEEVSLGFTGTYMTASVNGIKIEARLLEGRYPTWREVFPKSYSRKIPLMAGPLLSVTRQASCMMTEDSRGIDYAFEKGTCCLKSSSESGKANIQLPVAYDGPKVSVTLAGDLVAEILREWPGDTELTMKLVNGNTVMVMDFPGTYVSIIVPLARAKND